jgi:hypothetical protein
VALTHALRRPQELTATIPHFKVPYVFIIERGKTPWAMSKDFLLNSYIVRPTVVYADTQDLLNRISSHIVAPAEEIYKTRQRMLDEVFGHE